jgi:hypothetical protein
LNPSCGHPEVSLVRPGKVWHHPLIAVETKGIHVGFRAHATQQVAVLMDILEMAFCAQRLRRESFRLEAPEFWCFKSSVLKMKRGESAVLTIVAAPNGDLNG